MQVDGSEESDYGEESSRILSDEEMRMIREESYARRSPTRQNKPTAVRCTYFSIFSLAFRAHEDHWDCDYRRFPLLPR